MCNLIERQKAIDAVCAVCGNDCDKSKFIYDAPQTEQVIMCPEHYALSTLPLAQPEIAKRTAETAQNVSKSDLISRKAVIEPHSKESSETRKALDCISRQAAIELIGRMKPYHQDADDIAEMIANMPSAQHEIIHCKDCKNAKEDSLCGGYWCNGKAVTSNHYCGYAERREDVESD